MKNILCLLILITGSFSGAAVQTRLADKVIIGQASSSDKTLEFNSGLGASNPKIIFNNTTSKMQFSNSGVGYRNFGTDSIGLEINLLQNGDFESGISEGWNQSGGTFAAVTSGANLLYESTSASFVASTSNQYFETTAITVPEILKSGNCYAMINYKGSDANVYLTVMDGTSTELISAAERKTLATATTVRQVPLYFTCPSSGSVKLRIQSTAASVIGYYDEVVLGLVPKAGRNVAGRYLIGSTQTMNDNVIATLKFDSNDSDVTPTDPAMMNYVTGVWTAPIADFYQFNFCGGSQTSITQVSGNRISIYHRRNGGTWKNTGIIVSSGSVTEATRICGSDLMYFSSGDTLEIGLSMDYGTATYGIVSVNGGVNYLSIHNLKQ